MCRVPSWSKEVKDSKQLSLPDFEEDKNLQHPDYSCLKWQSFFFMLCKAKNKNKNTPDTPLLVNSKPLWEKG